MAAIVVKMEDKGYRLKAEEKRSSRQAAKKPSRQEAQKPSNKAALALRLGFFAAWRELLSFARTNTQDKS